MLHLLPFPCVAFKSSPACNCRFSEPADTLPNSGNYDLLVRYSKAIDNLNCERSKVLPCDPSHLWPLSGLSCEPCRICGICIASLRTLSHLRPIHGLPCKTCRTCGLCTASLPFPPLLALATSEWPRLPLWHWKGSACDSCGMCGF